MWFQRSRVRIPLLTLLIAHCHFARGEDFPAGFVFPAAMNQDLFDYLASFLTEERLARIEEVLAVRTRFVTVVLEHVHRTQNASACLRNCEAFGVQDVHVIEDEAGFRVNRDVARGAAGWLTIHRHQEQDAKQDGNRTRRCLDTLKEQGYRIVAVSGRDADGSLLDYEPQSPAALVFGNELSGLSETVVQEADEIHSLPMFGFTESFNLSVALALGLGTILPRVRMESVSWELSDAEKRELRERWIRQTLGHRADSLEREFHRRGTSLK